MGLSDLDQGLLGRCLAEKPRAWEDFVDRFLGLVMHVIEHSATLRGVRLTPDERDNLCEAAFAAIRHDNHHLLRGYRNESNLSTYLTVMVRRVIVRLLINGGYAIPTRSTGQRVA